MKLSMNGRKNNVRIDCWNWDCFVFIFRVCFSVFVSSEICREHLMSEVTKATKAKIINSLRRLTFSYKPRTEAMNRRKVAPATFSCEHCQKWVYSGKSEKNYDKIVSEFPDQEIEIGKVIVDHLEPVVNPKKGWEGWDFYITRMFCRTEGFQILCCDCDNIKKKEEIGERVETRKKRKKT